MKRLSVTMFAIVVMFTLFSASVAAQGLTGKGLKAGLNIANLRGDDMEDWDSKMGFSAGGFITYSINDMFAIQPEVLFTMKGAKYEEEILGETLKATTSLNYLEIPVLAKLSMPTQGSVKPNLFVGPSLAILLSAKGKVEYAGESEEVDIKDDTKSIDLGLVFGGGVDFDLGPDKGKLTADVRYTLGLTSIDESPEEVGGPYDVKNGVISLMVGYSF